MAPTKVKTGSAKGQNKRSNAPSKSGSSSKASSKVGKKAAATPKPKPTQQKAKSISHGPVKKKKRVYSEKELNIPTLNGIVPAGVQKQRGTKKGKTFVDDKETMMTILAMVQADKEGNIESKMIRARQMEEIREARKAEQEKKEAGRKQKLEETKDEIRKNKNQNKKSRHSIASEADVEKEPKAEKPKKKRVSFG